MSVDYGCSAKDGKSSKITIPKLAKTSKQSETDVLECDGQTCTVMLQVVPPSTNTFCAKWTLRLDFEPN